MSTPSALSGFVLAGGKSQRMGQDKAVLDWCGQPLLDHMLKLLAAVCDTVQIAGRADLPDTTQNLGPLGGMQTALCASKTDHNLITAVDLPLLTEEFLKHFKEQFYRSSEPLVVCQTAAHYPLLVGVRLSLLNPLKRYLDSGQRSLHGFIDTTPHTTITGAPPELFTNLNGEADYRAAIKSYKP